MDYVVALLGLALVHLLAVASPGPSTVLVIQTAAGRRPARRASGGPRHDGGRARLGGRGAVTACRRCSPASNGSTSPSASAARSISSIWRSMLWRHARDPLPEIPMRRRDCALTGWQGFLRALLLQLSNPKIMVFFGSIFLSLLPQNLPRLDGRHGAGHRGAERIHLVRAAGAAVLGRAGARFLPTRQNSGSIASWAAPWRCSACVSPSTADAHT